MKYLVNTLCLMVLLAGSSLAVAKDLILGVEDIEYYPLWAQRSGEYAGFARELFDQFAKEYNHTIQYKPLPIKRLYGEFLNGRLDFKFPDSPNWASDQKREHNVTYSDAVLEYIDGVMVLSGSEKTLATLGTVRGFTPWTYLDDIAADKIRVVENSNVDGLFKLIKSGRVDGGYFNVLVARHYLKHTLLQSEAFEFNEALPHSRGQYHLSTIKHPDVIEEFNQFLRDNAEFVSSLKNKFDINL